MRLAAWRRVLAAQDAAAAGMVELAFSPGVPIAYQYAARKDLLDRGGTTVRQQIELTVKPWEEALMSIVEANGGDIEITSGDVVDGEVVPEGEDTYAYDEVEPLGSASTSTSDDRRRSSVDRAGSTPATPEETQRVNREALARNRRRRGRTA